MVLAIDDAQMLNSEQLLSDTNANVRKESWAILLEHTIKMLENSLNGSVKISESLKKFITDLEKHKQEFQ